jgi:hypothetical protein
MFATVPQFGTIVCTLAHVLPATDYMEFPCMTSAEVGMGAIESVGQAVLSVRPEPVEVPSWYSHCGSTGSPRTEIPNTFDGNQLASTNEPPPIECCERQRTELFAIVADDVDMEIVRHHQKSTSPGNTVEMTNGFLKRSPSDHPGAVASILAVSQMTSFASI